LFIKTSDISTLPVNIKDLETQNIYFIFTPLSSDLIYKLFIREEVREVDETNSFFSIINVNVEVDEVIDNTSKQYESMMILGFKINFEPNVFELYPTLLEILTLDLTRMIKLLPVHATNKLRIDTFIWLNISTTYGTKNKPMDKDNCEFHPCKKWLRRNKFNEEKFHCIEIHSAIDYLRSKYRWGCGGLLLHEFCHAFHKKFCVDGFENEDIINVYFFNFKILNFYTILFFNNS
jgi:hypothetical protein